MNNSHQQEQRPGTRPLPTTPAGNRLQFSHSPYLLQHADNPVDWYEWGEEAFARARDEDRPVFLSIGYATCHWCHVMAHESFADPAVAAVLNRHYVAIKVDREERPDLDDQYMTVSQLMTGSGGWPLNLFLTPDRRPFYACTYLPKAPRGGVIGFVELLERLAEAWREQRGRVVETCGQVVAELQRLATPLPDEPPEPAVQQAAAAHLARLYDTEGAGFGQGHKFPLPVNLQLLLRVWRRSGDEGALRMTLATLGVMAAGGIHDQLGGGFHRYTVDRHWQVPHFEKMLYDQAQLAVTYLEAYQVTGDHDLLAVARSTLAYLERDLAAPEGGLYSAEDADSEGEEGRFYLWTPAQIAEVLGPAEGENACRLWGVTPPGNFEGRSILHRPQSSAVLATELGLPLAELQGRAESWRQQLLAARALRTRPLRDEKILTEWNALALAAFAKAHLLTGAASYLARAESIYLFLRGAMVRADGRLLRRWFRGNVAVPAFLDDYAALLWGVLELYQASPTEELLKAAQHWAAELLRLFVHPSGALQGVGHDAEQPLVPGAAAHDGVIPPGNALAAASLLRLAALVNAPEYAAQGMAIVRACAGAIRRQPAAYLAMLQVGDYYWPPAPVLTLRGGNGAARAAWRQQVAMNFVPGLVIRDGGGGGDTVQGDLCVSGACLPPFRDLAKLLQALPLAEFKQ